MIILILALLLECISSIKIVNHYTSDSGGGLNLDSSISIENIVESTWIIFIKNSIIKEANDAHIIERLNDEYITKKDDCILLKSALANGIITLKVYCNKSLIGEKEEDEQLASYKPLKHTLKYIKSTFGKDNVIIEKNMIVRKPHYHHWSGSYEHVDQILKAKKRAKERNRPLDLTLKEPFSPYDKVVLPYGWTNAVQSNPTWGLDRVDQRFGLLNNQYTYLNSASDVDIYIIGT